MNGGIKLRTLYQSYKPQINPNYDCHRVEYYHTIKTRVCPYGVDRNMSWPYVCALCAACTHCNARVGSTQSSFSLKFAAITVHNSPALRCITAAITVPQCGLSLVRLPFHEYHVYSSASV